MQNNPQITVNHLTKQFSHNGEQVTAFQDINFAVNIGEFVAILGPSGCGKSTLLRVISGLEKSSSGDFSIEKNKTSNADIAMVFQEHGLFPWMTLKRNIEFILENNPSISRDDIQQISREYFDIIGLTKYVNYFPHQVSGGMKQRVSIARSFATNPDILLMDEPFVFLDYQTRFLIHELLLKIWQGSNKTILFVTHDIDEAVLLADRIIVLSAQPGMIILDEKISISRPRDLIETRKTPEFVALVDTIIQLIRHELTA